MKQLIEVVSATIFHILDMNADPESLPTAEEIIFELDRLDLDIVVELNRSDHHFRTIAFQDWHFIDLPSSTEAVPEHLDLVLARIIVIDPLMMYKLKRHSQAIHTGDEDKILRQIGVEQYFIDNSGCFCCADRHNLIIMTRCDDFIEQCTLDIWRYNPSYEKRSFLHQFRYEISFLTNDHTDTHLMWRYDDDEVHGLYDVIGRLRARTENPGSNRLTG